MALVAYFLMRGEIVSVSTICLLLYPINVSKMCLNPKNYIMYWIKAHNKSHAEHGFYCIFSYEGGDSECFNYLSITIPNKCVKNVF